MARARVIITKRNNIPLEKEIREFVLPLSEKQTFVLSEETVKVIRDKIAESIQRPGSTGKLASGFFSEKIQEGYGIGNIDYLNQNAKYWHWQNYGIAQSGRTTPPTSIGTFTDGQPDRNSFRQGRFIHSSEGDGGYLMIPTRPLEAMNYIEKTIARIPELANQVLNTVK